ncbi:histidinol-phosphate transaminase [Sphingomonas sp. BN140010]|uniref:Imidazoleglycerol-phosphate dehydratase n=1 Tax=Sphingomonas arvum TaxID=2992113 RepID=A0ABT3JBJ3_9SPHN|nr:histidinol-phosphate transaminase [Sphingomonas sp. BN140010]MCW3796425.1 histidinol-phosphate transaminase [Sphingomonas sp. BN140010]
MSLAEYLARPEILRLPAFDLGKRDGNPFGSETIKLDANENPFPPLGSAGVNRYPEPQPIRLRVAMAALYGVAPDSFLVTRGGDDAIDLLVRTFCRPQEDAVAVCLPTFSAYAHFANLQGARVIEARLGADFAFEPKRLLDAVAGEANLKLVFICSPNNPTGTPVESADVLAVADALPNTMVLSDEAYLEFSDTPSLADEATRRPNLIVLKTLSKAFGLAGARVGGLVAAPETIAMVARAAPPYPLPTLCIDEALKALSPARRAVHLERIERIKAERERLAPLLATSPIVHCVHGSAGNFLFLEVNDAEALSRRLDTLGIRIRFRPNAAPGGVRLTIGTPEENDAALRAFEVPATAAPKQRRAELVRDTKETRIAVSVDLDMAEPRRIDTGVPFFDHMLDQVAAHGNFSLLLSCDGDLDIDAHHSVEDCAIALGEALGRALDDKRGIGRFGFALPMDETEAQVLIDLSGRPFCRFEGAFDATHIGAYPTEMTPHVFRSLADSMRAAIHVRVDGQNDHHKVEACFKAFGRALRQAVAREGAADALPSTKGVL